MEHHGLRLFDVKETQTHGGSARPYCCRAECGRFEETANVAEQLRLDAAAGFDDNATYDAFAERVRETKRAFSSS